MAQQQAHAAPPAQASAEFMAGSEKAVRWKYDPVKEKWEPSATVLKEVLPPSRSRSLPPSLSLLISPCPALPPSQVLLLHRVFICTWMDGSYIAHTYVTIFAPTLYRAGFFCGTLSFFWFGVCLYVTTWVTILEPFC